MSRTKELAKIIDDDIVTGQMVNNGAIVESGSNDDGSYERWESGLQVCFIAELIISLTDEVVGTKTWNFPASFVGAVRPFGVCEASGSNFYILSSTTGEGSATLRATEAQEVIKTIDVRAGPTVIGFYK